MLCAFRSDTKRKQGRTSDTCLQPRWITVFLAYLFIQSLHTFCGSGGWNVELRCEHKLPKVHRHSTGDTATLQSTAKAALAPRTVLDAAVERLGTRKQT